MLRATKVNFVMYANKELFDLNGYYTLFNIQTGCFYTPESRQQCHT